jgi:hypothetical protein
LLRRNLGQSCSINQRNAHCGIHVFSFIAACFVR